MQVKWKTPSVFIALLLILSLYGCNVSSKNSSISGRLTLRSGVNLSGQSIPISNIPISAFFTNKRGRGSLETDFVPDEIIVKYRPGLDPTTVSAIVGKELGSRNLSVLKEGTLGGKSTIQLLKLHTGERSASSTVRLKELTLSEIEHLRRLPEVEYAEPNYIYRVFSEPNDPYYSSLWHYTLIQLDKFWKDESLDQVDNLSGIRVAVIDSGIVRKAGQTHPDLTGTLFDEYDFVDKDADATDDPLGIFHGTHVAGTIGALTNNGIGIAGVAGGNGPSGQPAAFSGVQIIPIRALNEYGTGTTWDIAWAIRYASGTTTDYTSQPIVKADIINMSFGGQMNSSTIKNAIDYAYYTKKIVLVAAAGNEYTDTPMYPAAYPEVISVAAVDIGAQKAEYSNFGTTIDISAPGGFESLDLDFDGNKDGILSTYFSNNNFTYSYASGSSMAAPHVSGVAAIVLKALQVRTGSTDILPQTVKSYLTGTAIDLDNPYHYGAGLVNAYAAASAALGQPSPQLPVLFPFPKTVKLTDMTSSGSFVLKNIGNSDPITITSIWSSYDPSGLISSITPQSGEIDSDGLHVQVSFDIASLTDGRTYSARIDISDTDGNEEYVYTFYKYIGDVYVVAFDASSYDVVQMALTNYEEDFQYLLDNLPQGDYIIGASTDRNDNGYIFDAGEVYEVYGFFQSVSNQVSIRLNAGIALEGINFQIIDELL